MMAAGPRKGRVVATWDLWEDGCGLRYVLLLNSHGRVFITKQGLNVGW